MDEFFSVGDTVEKIRVAPNKSGTSDIPIYTSSNAPLNYRRPVRARPLNLVHKTTDLLTIRASVVINIYWCFPSRCYIIPIQESSGQG